MRSPEETLEVLDALHAVYSRIAHDLIITYAGGDKSVKDAQDQAEGAEQVIFIFAKVVQKQLSE